MILAILGEPHYRAIAHFGIRVALRSCTRSGIAALEAGNLEYMDTTDGFVATSQ
jgi:hypothetical protein